MPILPQCCHAKVYLRFKTACKKKTIKDWKLGIQDEKKRAGIGFPKATKRNGCPAFKAIPEKQSTLLPTAPRWKCIKSWETPQNRGIQSVQMLNWRDAQIGSFRPSIEPSSLVSQAFVLCFILELWGLISYLNIHTVLNAQACIWMCIMYITEVHGSMNLSSINPKRHRKASEKVKKTQKTHRSFVVPFPLRTLLYLADWHHTQWHAQWQLYPPPPPPKEAPCHEGAVFT